MSMNADQIRVDAITVPTQVDALHNSANPAPAGNQFSADLTGGISTLSTANTLSSTLNGILYVPTLLPDDAHLCDNSTQIPQAILDKSNRTAQPYVPKIAFAPWAAPDCQYARFRAARSVINVDAFLTYLPDNSSAQPPGVADLSWSLSDGGAWKSNSPWPVYAINGETGAAVMDLLNNYTTVPDVPAGTVWIEALVSLDSGSAFSVLPDLWTIVLAVLAAFVVVLASISGILHLLQRKRRNDLRRRILSGEVALEDIGIRKLTVPQELMDKMPVRKYGSLAGQVPTIAPADAGIEKGDIALSEKTPVMDGPGAAMTPTLGQSSTDGGTAMLRHYNQPTCPICLDDFAADTDVRCLPCDHIFHPECCDVFLRENSSLCPMCKKSVLPRGYCPTKITNVMVRREQLARMRARGQLDPTQQQQRPRGAAARIRGLFPRRSTGHMHNEPRPVEMTSPAPRITVPMSPSDLPPPAPAPGLSAADNCTPSRREWARRRALQLLGNHATTTEEEDLDRATRAPAWRRAIARVFPNSSSV